MSLADYVPSWMLRMGPAELAIWQWLGIVVALGASWLVARVIAFIIVKIALAAASRTRTTYDDELIARLRSPLRALANIGVLRAVLPLLELHADARGLARDLLLASFALVLVWGTLRAIDLSINRMTTASWAASRPTSRAVLVLVGRIIKVLVVVIAGIGFLAGLGLPVASLLAGLGIGGIALAFGAQKTVENLFGAVAIGIDQPLREGDFVRTEADVLGTVEKVGLRSTRIRTLDRTIVTLPNGKLADMRIETFALRDRCRLHAMIGVVYSTTAAQLREVLVGFERVLRAHPHIWADDMVVRFVGFGASSLDIEVMAWFRTHDWGVFRAYRQEVLLGFMDVVEQAKTSIAFPTRTIHIASDVRSQPAR